MSDRTEISLNNFFIYNHSLSSKEGEEKNKILFYYPLSSSLDEQLKNVGFSEAILRFSQTFNPDKPCETISTKKTRQFYLQPEEDFWMVMTVNLPKIKSKEMADEYEYLEHDVQDAVYLAILKLAYNMAKLFIGTFSASLEENNPKPLRIKLEKFFVRYLATLKLQNCDVTDIFQGVQYLSLDPLRFLHVQSLSNLLEAEFPQIESSVILYEKYLIWSGLDYSDMQLINQYVKTLRVASNLESEAESGSKTSASTNICRFLTGPKNFLEEDPSFLDSIPIIHIYATNPPKRYYLNVYQAINFIVCILIDETESLTLELLKKLDKFLGDKLIRLNSKIKTAIPQVAALTLQAPMEKFLYFNKLNLAMKVTVGNKSSSVTPEEVMRVVTDIAVQNQSCCRHSSAAETVVKLMKLSDFWIVGKMSDARECYFIMQAKNASLSFIYEEANKMCNMSLKSIFVHK